MPIKRICTRCGQQFELGPTRRNATAHAFEGCADRSLADAFWRDVRRGEDCWEWGGRERTKGYGAVWWNGQSILAHRVSYELHNGPIPDGMWVLHHCDNPPCCNPAHLYLGTAVENGADAASRKRHHQDGELAPSAKLTEIKVRQIRDRYALGTETFGGLGREFGVSKVNIRYIVQRKSWRHVA